MQLKGKQSAREKLLQAAEELAWETGPGNLSLEAVAARAGVSKGGLLYHFPTKQNLMEALVESFIKQLDDDLTKRETVSGAAPNATAKAYLELFVQEHRCNRPPPSGLLAAMAENPSYLDPIRAHQRILLDRMKASASDSTLAVLVFLVVQGIKSMDLLAMRTLDEAELGRVVKKLEEMLS